MATYTTNYNLKKPDSSDPFGDFRGDYNDNLDIIDANLGGGGGGGHTIVDADGNSLPQEDELQFTGAVSVTDDNVNGRTVVNVSGGSNLILDAQIYSTEEKQVGVWTDKKPLYAKTYTATITSGTQWIDTGLDSGDLIVKSEGTLEQNNGQILTLASGDTGAGAGINTFIVGVVTPSKWSCLFRTTSNDARGNLTLTLYYTKGSDVAGSGGYEAYGFSPVIYSDVERVIGVWRDNKPLYAKTFVQHSTDISGAGVSFDVSALDIDTCVDVFGTCDRIVTGVGTLIYPFNAYEDASLRTYLAYSKFDTHINFNIRFYVGESTSTQYITILYTKTTDVAGSGDYNTYGVPTVHYSTSEQVIGTWIDGKPLYEQTITLGSLPNNAIKTVAHGIANVDLIFVSDSFFVTPSGASSYLNFTNDSTTGQTEILVDKTNVEIWAGSNRTTWDGYVTVRYTKTTD